MKYKEFMLEKRKDSEEKHFGCWWTLDSHFPKYAVRWIARTGDLYAVSLGKPDPAEEEVIFIGTFEAEEDVDRFMHDWRDIVAKPGSLANLLGRKGKKH